MQTKQETKPCLCGEPGERNAIEVLPDGGTLMMVVHDSGKVCKWAEGYHLGLDASTQTDHSVKAFGRAEVICPACGQKGAATTYAKDNRIPYVLEYYIRHEILNEKWAHGRAKERRCTKFTQEQRDEILKQLGRYISTPKIIDKSETSQIQKRTGMRSEAAPVLQKQIPKTAKGYSANDRFIQSPINEQPTKEFRHVKLRNKKLVTCTVCNKPGYSYRTYYQHYNEPPVGKVILKGKVIGDKFRRCYRLNQKDRTEPKEHMGQITIPRRVKFSEEYMKSLESHPQVNIQQIRDKNNAKHLGTLDPYVKSGESGPQKTSISDRNIQCPDCHKNGLLCVATNMHNLRKISFYVRHEKLRGKWGNKHKVDQYRRCWISRRNKKQMAYLKKMWTNIIKLK